MNIPLISGQLAKLHVKLETEDDFELYGGTTKAGFSITPERPESKNEWLVTIDELEVAGKPLTRFDVYVRQISSGREWVVLSGKILVTPRSAGVEADKLAPIEYNVMIPVVENAVDLTGAAIVTGIPGPRGWSAYEIAVQNGFVGSESEWLEHIRQQTATLAVEQVTPLMQRAETAADKSEREATAAKTEQENAAAHAKAAKESELAAAGHKTAAAGEVTKAAAEVTKAAAEVEKAKLERETAAGHATAAAKSAQDALENQQGAKQAAQDAAQAQVGAEQAKTGAEAAKTEAQTAEGNAKASANQAAADKTAAEKAKADAQAAQTKAEQEAIKAEQAAADAQAPESIAAQAACPATMLLVRDELLSILGDASLFDLDTDGRKIIVHTDRLSDDQLAVVTDMLERFVPGFIDWVQYNHNIEISWRVMAPIPLSRVNKYDSLVTLTKETMGGYEYQQDVYQLTPELQDWLKKTISPSYWDSRWETNCYAYVFSSATKIILTNLTWDSSVCIYLPKLEDGSSLNWGYGGGLVYIYAPVMKKLLTRSPNFAGYFPQLQEFVKHGAAISSWLCDIDFPALKKGVFSDSSGQTWLQRQSVLRILNSIPTYSDGGTYTLSIGIHIDHQNDEEVLAAIANAEAKGWKLTVQWNPNGGEYFTPASTTYGLRKPPIYAKVGEIERPDGTTERVLDWGHYVTDPTGYTEFPNLEVALEEWGLTEYVPEMPEETLTTTE